MNAHATFFLVYAAALALIQVSIAAIFLWRSTIESSRRMAYLAMAYAWSAPLAIGNIIALPAFAMPAGAISEQVGPALWVAWHVGWALAMLAYVRAGPPDESNASRYVPLVFVGAVACTFLAYSGGAVLPAFLDPHEHLLAPLLAGSGTAFILALIVAVPLVRAPRTARDRWIAIAVALAALEAGFMLFSGERFSRPFYLGRVAGLASAIVVLGAMLTDLRGLARRAREDASRSLLVGITENTSGFVGLARADGTSIYINAAGRAMLEIAADDVSHLTMFDCIADEDRARYRAEIVPTLDRGGVWTGNLSLRNQRTGVAIPCLFNGMRVAATDGSYTYAAVAQDRREQLRTEINLRLVARAGAAVNRLDAGGALAAISHACIEEFASCCTIDAFAPGGAWVRTAAHRDPTLQEALALLPRPAGEHPIMQAANRGAPLVMTLDENWAEVHDLDARRVAVWKQLDIRHVMVVPIVNPAGEHVGALTVGLDGASGRAFGPFDLPFLEEVGRRAGASIANARLYERQERIAIELQAASLPARLPDLDDGVLYADYRPGSDEATIGGDWYDAFVLEDGRLAITVGDVLGHGLRAAVTMTKLRQAMQSAAMVDTDPRMMLVVADRTMRLVDPNAYATALAAIYDPRARTLALATAGHPGPVMHAASGAIHHTAVHGMLLGLGSGVHTYALHEVDVPAETTIVFYTDGLIEATRDLALGHERLRAAVRSVCETDEANPARAIVNHVLAGAAARDDIAVLVLATSASDAAHVDARDAQPPARAMRWTFESRDGDAARVMRKTLVSFAGTRDGRRFDGASAEIVLGELVGNVERHAPGIVHIEAEWLADGVAIAVTNDGPAFDLDAAGAQETLAESGRGLQMIRLFSRSLTVSANAEGQCTVRAVIPYAN
jgi:serine phosphatase RsbU (regulator of sigma subunit)/anti-sigma regulatory factor (Ser/Thr protein kinase)